MQNCGDYRVARDAAISQPDHGIPALDSPIRESAAAATVSRLRVTGQDLASRIEAATALDLIADPELREHIARLTLAVETLQSLLATRMTAAEYLRTCDDLQIDPRA